MKQAFTGICRLSKRPCPSSIRFVASEVSTEYFFLLFLIGSKFFNQAYPRPAPELPSVPSTRYKAVTHPPEHIQSELTKAAVKRDSTYLLPVYARPNFVLSHGKGSYVWDTEGRQYLDFSAGIAVNALGHADEGVLKVSIPFSPLVP